MKQFLKSCAIVTSIFFWLHCINMSTTTRQYFESRGKMIELKSIDGVKYACVTQCISVLIDGNYQASKTRWSRIKKATPSLVKDMRRESFGGKGSKSKWVVNSNNLINIIFTSFQKESQQYCSGGIVVELLNALDPDGNYIEIMNKKLKILAKLELGFDDENSCNDKDVDDSQSCDTSITLVPRSNNETCLYVRVKYPDDYVVQVENIKQLTLDILKFGIGFSVHDRNMTYQKTPDNGYMLYGFQCCSREEADTVERVMKIDFASITVQNSKEYICTHELAKMLRIECVPGSYESYINLARELYIYMVKIVKKLWPEKYANYFGNKYSIIANSLQDNESHFEISFKCDRIHWTEAIDMGLVSKDHDTIPIKSEAIKETASSRPKSYGEIISVDMITGKEEIHANVAKGAESIVFTPASLMSLINSEQFRQMAGKVWTWKGGAYWVPPRGLQVDVNSRTKDLRYIKRIENEDVKVYEDPTIAATMNGLIARNITRAADLRKQLDGVTWSWVQQDELTVTTNDISDVLGRTSIIELPKNGADGRCRGKIIERDITTGEEKVHDSAYLAACRNSTTKEQGCRTDLNQKMMSDHLVDKMRPANGKVFRSYGATMRWQPPSYYVRNEKNITENWPNSSNTISGLPWIVCTDESGKVLGLYETKKTAYKITDVSNDQLKRVFGNGILLKGKYWRYATKEECGVWVPCTPPSN